MKRVYLDQNKWIDLAKQVHGKADDSLVGATVIAPNYQLLPGEVDTALQIIFERPSEVREIRPFGYGASHAFGMPIGPYRLPEELKHRVGNVYEFERRANRHLEQELLIGPSPEEEPGLEGYDPFAHLEVGERYAKAKEELRDLRVSNGWHKGERGERVAKAQAISDHLPVLREALERAEVPEAAFIAGGKDGLSAFVEAVPTMLASSELERQRHASSQKPWEPHDLNDIGALSVAIAHCDIVVTERLWADAARRSKLDEKLSTVVLSNLEDLPEYLVTAG